MATYERFMAEAAAIYADNEHLLPTYGHMIASALFPIVVGSYASLSRPSSAAKPEKKAKNKKKDHGDDEDEEDEEVVQKMEGLSSSDAIVFPVVAATVLAGLYWLIKKYGADPVNLIFGWYFFLVGIFSMVKLVHNGCAVALSLLFPTYFAKDGKLCHVMDKSRAVVQVDNGRAVERSTSSPLPGFLRVPLPAAAESALWTIRSTPRQKYTVSAYVKRVLDATINVTALEIFALLVGVGANAYNQFIDKPWWLTNLQGFAVSYQTLQFLSPTTFPTGSLILMGLFCYDIWAVFFTPLMVTVAKNLDQPIKLMIPRPDEPSTVPGKPPTKAYSMLGLGDIVLPGLMIGLALRFDLYLFYLRRQTKTLEKDKSGEQKERIVKPAYTTVTGHWGSRLWTIGLPASSLPVSLASAAFPKPYFFTSIVGYIVGMVVTLLVMSVWQHAQPALLYLVPGVLISVWGAALVRGELKEMWNYTENMGGESVNESEDKKDEKDKKDSDKANATNKDDASKESESWWAWLSGSSKKEKATVTDSKDAEDKKSSETKGGSNDKAKTEKAEKPPSELEIKAREDPDHFFSLSIRRYRPKKSDASSGKAPSATQDTSKKAEKKVSEAVSDSGSDDVVLVSKDDDEVDAEGPSTRTRSRRGKPSGVKRV